MHIVNSRWSRQTLKIYLVNLLLQLFFFPLLICQPKEFLEILSEKREHEKEVRRGQTGRKQLSEGT